VVVAPAPFVQPVPVAVAATPAAPAIVSTPAVAANIPAPTTIYRAAAPVSETGNQHLQQLSNPDAAIRQNAVMELGKQRVDQAVDPLSASLAGDANPSVREAAARALGLIAAPRSLPALIRAAQADNDREVRHSAQFAVEVIRSNLKQQ
jgi:HEAT repeat protein